MANKRHNRLDSLDAQLRRSVEWLQAQSYVRDVVLGSITCGKHSHPPGMLRVVSDSGEAGIKLRGYFTVGSRDIFAYTDPEHRLDLVKTISERWNSPLNIAIVEGMKRVETLRRAPELVEMMTKGGTCEAEIDVMPLPTAQSSERSRQHQRDEARRRKQDHERYLQSFKPDPSQFPQEPPFVPREHSINIPASDRERASLIMKDTPPSDAPRSEWMTITPQLAFDWLDKFNTHNRPQKKDAVKRYADDMREGRWEPFTHQGIAFYKNPLHDADAVLLDGQNRLWAVIEADKPVMMQVNVNIPMAAQKTMDDHVRRRMTDVIAIEHPHDLQGVSSSHTACANRMIDPNATKTGGTGSRGEQYAFIEKHWEAIDFAVNGAFNRNRKRSITISPVYAAIARASYHLPHDALKRFAQVLMHGRTENEDEISAIILRNWLLGLTSNSAGRRLPVDVVYRKTERAIAAFAAHERISKLYEGSGELFPLPEESALKSTNEVQ